MPEHARRPGLSAIGLAAMLAPLALEAGCRPSPVVAHAPATATMRPAAPGSVSTWLDTPIDPTTARAAGVLADGRRAFTLGGHRIALGPGKIEWASERFASPIATAVEVADGWLFVAEDGAAARAPSFLGPLARVGGLDQEVVVALAGSGRAAVITRSAALFTSDGRADFARAPLPAAVRASDGAFADAQRGVVLTEGGGAYATHDGGATFVALPLGREAAWRVDLAGRELVVTTTAGAEVVTSAGTLSPLPPGTKADTGTSWLPPASFHGGPEAPFFPRDRELEVIVSRWARFPASAELADSPTFARTADGAFLHSEPGELFWLTPATGASTALPLGDGMPLDRDCALLHWGEAPIAHCEPDEGPGGVWRFDGERRPLRVPDLAPGPSAAFSDDGLHVAWLGSCAGDDDARTLCGQRSGEVAKDFALDFEAAYLLGLRGGRALVRGSLEGSDDTSYRVVDLDTGVVLALRVAAPGGQNPAPAIEHASLATAELVVATAAVDGGPRWLAMGNPGEPLPLRALPKGARAAGFADAQRGVAAGRVLGEVWVTDDAGASWSAVPAAVDGGSDTLPLEPRDDAPAIDCDERGCRVGPSLYLAFDAPRSVDPPPLARAVEGAPVALDDDDDDVGIDGEPLPHASDPTCGLELAPGAPASEPLPASTYPPPTESHVLELGWGGVRARLDVLPAPTWRAELRWHLPDVPPLVSHLTALPVASPDADRGTQAARYALVAADARHALVLRCTGRLDLGCELLRATAGGPVELVAFVDALAAPPNTSSQVVPLPLRDGGALVLVAGRAVGIADGIRLPDIDLVLRIGPDGALAGRRAFAWTDRVRRRSALALRDGIAGYVASAPDDRERLEFYALERDLDARAEPFATLPSVRVAPCEARPGSPTNQLLLPLPATAVGIAHDLGVLEGVATLDVSASGACLATFDSAFELPIPGFGPPAPRANLHLDAQGGELAGSLVDHVGRRHARCTGP